MSEISNNDGPKTAKELPTGKLSSTGNITTQTHIEDMEKLAISPTGGDVAGQIVDINHQGNFTPEQDRKVLRRIDMVLMPLLFLTNGMLYMDKSCLTNAALFGLIKELKLYTVTAKGVNDDKYANATLIFYWGYLAGMLPGVYIAQRFPIGKYVAIIVFLWGCLTMCTAAIKSYHGLLVLRFFLGFSESGISPALQLITAMWWRRSEQPIRNALWFSSTGISSLIGAFVFYGIGHIHGRLAVWQYMFLFVGCASSVLGIVLWFLLPDNPVKAKFLSSEMKEIALERMRLEQTGVENKRFKWAQAKEAVLDPKSWLYVAMIMAVNMANGAASGFGSIIVNSFGFPLLKTMLLLGASGVTSFFFLLGCGLLNVFRRNSRIYAGMFCCLSTMAGCIMVWKSNWADKAVPLWGFFLITTFTAAQLMILTLVSANTAGHTKKSVTNGMVWATFAIANGIAPRLVITTQVAQHYPTLFITVLSMMAFIIVALGFFRVYISYMNKKKDGVSLVEEHKAAATGFRDLTDRENPNFRYQW